ncbi:hypothetical protein [Micromonospora musae]|uniref:hypothetical protein n=1 Tax=Micromonospora musae TaxID=1894970 RepID=UPI0033C0ABBA
MTDAGRGRLAAALIAFAAFGPYLAAGVRTEQLAVYGTAGLLLLAGAWTRMRLGDAGIWVVALQGSVLAVALIGVVIPPVNLTLYASGNLVAGVDNLLLPIVVILLVGMMVGAGADRLVMIRSVCAVTVWTMSANAVLAFTSIDSGGEQPAILTTFRLFGDGESVADRAEQLGRYSGIFNQPAEAGLLYSVALLAAVYLYREQAVKFALTASLLTVGGILAVSKVFLLIGMPVALWQVFRNRGGRWRRIAAVSTAVVAAAVLGQLGRLPEWTGSDYILRLIPGTGSDTVGLYTGGRFGQQSTLSDVIDAVAYISPTMGVGAAGLQMPYDNAWVEAFVVGGVLGVLLHSAVLVALAASWWLNRSAGPESAFAGGLILVVACASAGVPALTANRCATVVWLLLSLLLLARPFTGRHRKAATVLTREHRPLGLAHGSATFRT